MTYLISGNLFHAQWVESFIDITDNLMDLGIINHIFPGRHRSVSETIPNAMQKQISRHIRHEINIGQISWPGFKKTTYPVFATAIRSMAKRTVLLELV